MGLELEIDERLAEYDYGSDEYVPVEQMRTTDPQRLERLANGELPGGIDVNAFVERVSAAVEDLSTTSEPRARIAVVCHGGVINVLLGQAIDTQQLFPFRLDYVSISHLHVSARKTRTILGVNNIEHVWDLLPQHTRSHRDRR